MTATHQQDLSYQFMPRERLLGLTQARFETDLWGVAAVFYYVLSGEFPCDFSRHDPVTVILQSEVVPLRERDRRIPDPVAKVVDRGLSSDPDKRYASATEMKAQLVRAFDRVRGA